jgi:hypothetical protein
MAKSTNDALEQQSMKWEVSERNRRQDKMRKLRRSESSEAENKIQPVNHRSLSIFCGDNKTPVTR